VVEVNSGIAQRPESVNTAPHDTWMIVIKVTNPADMNGLLDSTAYTDLTK
jgi:glycine cleavage system H lipoate-binding protein